MFRPYWRALTVPITVCAKRPVDFFLQIYTFCYQCSFAVTVVFVTGKTGTVYTAAGTAAGRVERNIPLRFPRRTSDGARAEHHPGLRERSRARRVHRATGSVHAVAESFTPTDGAWEIRRIPSENQRGVDNKQCRSSPCGEYSFSHSIAAADFCSYFLSSVVWIMLMLRSSGDLNLSSDKHNRPLIQKHTNSSLSITSFRKQVIPQHLN